MNSTAIKAVDTAARILMAALFIYSGYGKLVDPGSVTTRLAAGGFPLPMLGAYGAILVELGGAALLIGGYRLVATCTVLALYTVMATAMFHQFWAVEGAQRVAQTYQFLKNACILSGLWFIARPLVDGLASPTPKTR
jgi:putative oxidoreductase